MPWSEFEASAAIEEIVADADAHFDAERFWPSHPREDGSPDGMANLYFGAAGVMWGLDYLARSGATRRHLDFRPVLPRLLEASATEFATGQYSAHGAFLLGDLGAALVAMRTGPSADVADLVHERCERNSALPIRELMWGLPGSMLASIHMHAMTGEPRWRHVFATQAGRLLDDLEDTALGPLWNQDLYGRVLPWLGPVHGYAGNMIPLLRGWEWLTHSQRARVADVVPRTLAATACRSEAGATWRAIATRSEPPSLCQHCHGAPGIVTTFADAPFVSPELDALLVEGGTFTWAAGPLAKGSNSLPRHRRQRIRVPQASSSDGRSNLAGVCPRLCHDGDRPVPRRTRRAREGPLLAVDRRRRTRDLPLGLRHRGAALPDR